MLMRAVHNLAKTGSRIALLWLALLPALAGAQTSFEYNTQPRIFRACRLLVPYQKPDLTWRIQAPDARSLLFEGMRRYPDKPAGWDLENPLAATPNLLKNTNSYWETPLNPATLDSSAALPQLDGMDLIYIWFGGRDADGDDEVLNLIQPQWREALIRAVHGGAVLWIDQKRDNSGTQVTEFAPPGPVPPASSVALQLQPPFNFAPGGAPAIGSYRRSYAGTYPADSGVLARNITDRLLRYPFNLHETRDVPYLGMFPTLVNSGTIIPDTAPESASPDAIALNDPSFHRVVAVWDGSNWLNNIAVARFGAGAIVLTAGDVGYDIVNWWYGAHRNRPLQQEAADCKFAWNLLALASTFAERGGSPTNTAASAAVIPPPLGIQWQYPGRFDPATAAPIGSVVSSPVAGRNLTFAVTQGRVAAGGIPGVAPTLLAFDSDPARDLDDDGRADDGVTDYATGREYDLVWYQPLDADWQGNDGDLTPRWSSPTVATMQLPTGENIEVVLVSLTFINPANAEDGAVVCYRADNGTYLWTKMIYGYGQGRVVDLSTPTVFRNFVFVLSSEYENGADAGGGAEDTYGRAHCFLLSYPWAAGNQNTGPQWVYPSESTNPNGDGDTTGGTPDASIPEPQRSLPPFQDPYWVAGVAPYATRPILPPYPTPKPTVSQPDPPGSNAGVDVLLHCPSPISLFWNGSQVDNAINGATVARGGSLWTLLPTPQVDLGAGLVDVLNQRAFRVWLPEATDPANTQFPNPIVTRPDNPNITAVVTGLWQDPTDGRVYAYLRSGEAREYLLSSVGGTGGQTNWLTCAQGMPIAIDYQTRAAAGDPWAPAVAPFLQVAAMLPGPVQRVAQYEAPHQRIAGSVSAAGGKVILPSDVWENNAGQLLRNDMTTSAAADVPATIASVDVATGETNWALRPATTGVGTGGMQLAARGGVAVDRAAGTAVAAVANVVDPDALNQRAIVAEVLGLDTTPRLRITLRAGGVADSQIRRGSAILVRTLDAAGAGPTTVPPTAYRVEADTNTIEFIASQAGWVDDTVGSLWGKWVYVTYNRTDPADPGDPGSDVPVLNEAHALPDLVRHQYMPGVVRLRHSFVRADAGTMTFDIPNGVNLTLVSDPPPGAPIVTFPQPVMSWPAGWNSMYSQPLIDVSGLTFASGEPLRPGSDLVITYEYRDEITGAVLIARERHQVPVTFGAPVSSPAVAGWNAHVGTEGYVPTGERGVALVNPEAVAGTPSPAQLNRERKTFLSVVLDPLASVMARVTAHGLWGAISAAAIPEANTYGVGGGVDRGAAVTTSSPLVDADGVIVGSRMMTGLTQNVTYQGENLGFVSRLKPERTLICDNTRLVETIGQRLNWVCYGSTAPMYHEALDPNTMGAQELKVTAFSRPAKAIYLPTGHMLVADTGNNRVVEIDRQGRQVWPLDVNGYDYYTSSPNGNPNLILDRPADCFRYYVTVVGANTYTSVNGAVLPGTETHTVIADTGNARVVDVVTIVDALGVQAHRVDVLTPTRVRLATGLMEIAYTRAIPVFDPISNAVIGYVCAASNMHQLAVVERGTRRVNPASNSAPPYGSAGSTWAWLAWLYDANVADPDYAPTNPLVFRNIRDVQFVREGPQMFLTVTCGQFAGRLANLATGIPPHFLAAEGAGVFEFALDISDTTAPYVWPRFAPTDAPGGPTVTVDDPVWWFTRRNYMYSDPAAGTRRSLTNLAYRDAGETPADPVHYLEMPWNPVSCSRLPTDRRPVNVGGVFHRQARHLVTNYAELIQHLTRDNTASLTAPPSLYSSVFVAATDDLYDAAPENDTHELDRREVIPDPHEPDWTDPINQPAYADRR
jgi:hypothetical protein